MNPSARGAKIAATFLLIAFMTTMLWARHRRSSARHAPRQVLDVVEVDTLEQLIAKDGMPLSLLMERAGEAVAKAVRFRIPAPSPVIVLAGSGNNGGDGWVAARSLARHGYPVTVVVRESVEHLHTEPARFTAQAVLAEAQRDHLAFDILVTPDSDTLLEAMRRSSVIIDAIVGTGFAGMVVRPPYADWIRAANASRLKESDGQDRSKQENHRSDMDGARVELQRDPLPPAENAPFAVSIDTPSGLSAQTGTPALPCFIADLTVTMLAYKPGLIVPAAARWTGNVELATLVDTKLYLKALHSESSRTQRKPDIMG